MDKIKRRQIADKTRITILKAAQKLFAQHGFSGTSTQAIAQLAKVNETLIFHHFGNKALLWQKVKENIIADIPIETLDLEPKSFRAFLEKIITQRLDAYRQKPELARLLQWQRMESKRDKLIAGNILAPSAWLKPIQYLQKTKKISATIQPEIIMIWITSSINAIIFDDMHYFKEKNHIKNYLDCIISGFDQALSK